MTGVGLGTKEQYLQHHNTLTGLKIRSQVHCISPTDIFIFNTNFPSLTRHLVSDIWALIASSLPVITNSSVNYSGKGLRHSPFIKLALEHIICQILINQSTPIFISHYTISRRPERTVFM
jgi:hypothetical protein